MEQSKFKIGQAYKGVLVLIMCAFFFCQSSAKSTGHIVQQSKKDYTKFVNPFIGTSSAGHTFPGACSPFGMVQVSPETGYAGWDYCAGYRYEDKKIMGFSHTHPSGTGWMDLGDILLMPFTGDVRKDSYKSGYSHGNESAFPGFYSVLLDDYNVKVELTASQRSAFHKYVFNGSTEGHILIDLRHGLVPAEKYLEEHVTKSDVKIIDKHTVSGYRITGGWAKEKHVYFIIQFKQPILSADWLSPQGTNRNQRLSLTFKGDKTPLEIDLKIALSTVSIENAEGNLKKEIPKWDFGRLKNETRTLWNTYLSKIEVEGNDKEKEIFYTSLYHTMVTPNNLADVNGSYRGADRKVYHSKSRTYYSTLSLWDTFRAAHPLYTLICPEKVKEIIGSMLEHYEVKGYLPVWPIWGYESHSMIGNHAIPVIVDAYMKGIRGYDVDKAYESIKKSSEVNHEKSDWDIYLKYGYLPFDLVRRESVSRTLEFGIDDWSVAQMAKALGHEEDYNEFSRRSKFYKNLYDKSTGLMRPKDSNGKWKVPFDAFVHRYNNEPYYDYTEGNAWQYTWHVMQDIDGLIGLMGGKENFSLKLDSLFTLETPNRKNARVDENISGLIGQYAHGNEPSHHIAYLYNYADKSWKTQEKVSQILTTLYDNTPEGICGNEDCGQMSAWFAFSSLGFYPVNPADGKYVFGSPLFEKAILNIGEKPFIIESKNLSSENIYIQKVELNGRPYPEFFIRHQDIVRGGHLIFTMGASPKK